MLGVDAAWVGADLTAGLEKVMVASEKDREIKREVRVVRRPCERTRRASKSRSFIPFSVTTYMLRHFLTLESHWDAAISERRGPVHGYPNLEKRGLGTNFPLWTARDSPTQILYNPES